MPHVAPVDLSRDRSRGRSASAARKNGAALSPLVALAVGQNAFNSKVDEMIARFGAEQGDAPPPLPEDGELDRDEHGRPAAAEAAAPPAGATALDAPVSAIVEAVAVPPHVGGAGTRESPFALTPRSKHAVRSSSLTPQASRPTAATVSAGGALPIAVGATSAMPQSPVAVMSAVKATYERALRLGSEEEAQAIAWGQLVEVVEKLKSQGVRPSKTDGTEMIDGTAVGSGTGAAEVRGAPALFAAFERARGTEVDGMAQDVRSDDGDEPTERGGKYAEEDIPLSVLEDLVNEGLEPSGYSHVDVRPACRSRSQDAASQAATKAPLVPEEEVDPERREALSVIIPSIGSTGEAEILAYIEAQREIKAHRSRSTDVRAASSSASTLHGLRPALKNTRFRDASGVVELHDYDRCAEMSGSRAVLGAWVGAGAGVGAGGIGNLSGESSSGVAERGRSVSLVRFAPETLRSEMLRNEASASKRAGEFLRSKSLLQRRAPAPAAPSATSPLGSASSKKGEFMRSASEPVTRGFSGGLASLLQLQSGVLGRFPPEGHGGSHAASLFGMSGNPIAPSRVATSAPLSKIDPTAAAPGTALRVERLDSALRAADSTVGASKAESMRRSRSSPSHKASGPPVVATEKRSPSVLRRSSHIVQANGASSGSFKAPVSSLLGLASMQSSSSTTHNQVNMKRVPLIGATSYDAGAGVLAGLSAIAAGVGGSSSPLLQIKTSRSGRTVMPPLPWYSGVRLNVSESGEAHIQFDGVVSGTVAALASGDSKPTTLASSQVPVARAVQKATTTKIAGKSSKGAKAPSIDASSRPKKSEKKKKARLGAKSATSPQLTATSIAVPSPAPSASSHAAHSQRAPKSGLANVQAIANASAKATGAKVSVKAGAQASALRPSSSPAPPPDDAVTTVGDNSKRKRVPTDFYRPPVKKVTTTRDADAVAEPSPVKKVKIAAVTPLSVAKAVSSAAKKLVSPGIGDVEEPKAAESKETLVVGKVPRRRAALPRTDALSAVPLLWVPRADQRADEWDPPQVVALRAAMAAVPFESTPTFWVRVAQLVPGKTHLPQEVKSKWMLLGFGGTPGDKKRTRRTVESPSSPSGSDGGAGVLEGIAGAGMGAGAGASSTAPKLAYLITSGHAANFFSVSSVGAAQAASITSQFGAKGTRKRERVEAELAQAMARGDLLPPAPAGAVTGISDYISRFDQRRRAASGPPAANVASAESPPAMGDADVSGLFSPDAGEPDWSFADAPSVKKSRTSSMGLAPLSESNPLAYEKPDVGGAPRLRLDAAQISDFAGRGAGARAPPAVKPRNNKSKIQVKERTFIDGDEGSALHRINGKTVRGAVYELTGEVVDGTLKFGKKRADADEGVEGDDDGEEEDI